MRIDRQLQRNTTIARALTLGRNMLENMNKLAEYPNAAEVDFDGAAVLCGAGPSLTRMLPRVRELQESGVLVVCVNTALPALHRVGIVPNVLVVIEPVDVSEHMRDRLEGIHQIVIDIAANPAIWDAAIGYGKICALLSNTTNNMRMALELGIEPIEHGGSAMEAAVGWLLKIGTRSIGLVGVDLSFPGQQTYAEGAGWEVGLRVDGPVFVIEQPQNRIDAHERSGVEAPPSIAATHTIDHTDGPSQTNAGYISQVRGLEHFARCYPRRNLVQSHGAVLGGWGLDPELQTLTDELTIWACPLKSAVTHEALELWCAQESRRCTAVSKLCTEMLAPGATFAHLDLLNSSDLVETLAAGDCFRIHDNKEMERADKIRAVYREIDNRAQETLSCLNLDL